MNPIIPIRRAGGRTHLLQLPAPPDPVTRTSGWSGTCEFPQNCGPDGLITIGWGASRAATVGTGTEPEPGSQRDPGVYTTLQRSVTDSQPNSRALPPAQSLRLGGKWSGGGHGKWSGQRRRTLPPHKPTGSGSGLWWQRPRRPGRVA